MCARLGPITLKIAYVVKKNWFYILLPKIIVYTIVIHMNTKLNLGVKKVHYLWLKTWIWGYFSSQGSIYIIKRAISNELKWHSLQPLSLGHWTWIFFMEINLHLNVVRPLVLHGLWVKWSWKKKKNYLIFAMDAICK